VLLLIERSRVEGRVVSEKSEGLFGQNLLEEFGERESEELDLDMRNERRSQTKQKARGRGRIE